MGGGGQSTKGKPSVHPGKSPSGGGGPKKDSRSSTDSKDRPAATKSGPVKSPVKGKHPPQKRPETPESMALRLFRTFPPKVSEIPEYLKTCRAVQSALNSGKITKPKAEEVFYLIASCVETLAEERIDRLFDSEYRQQLHEMRTKAGLGENEYFTPGDPRMPPEYQELLDEFRRRKWEILATFFREHGQHQTAAMVVEDHAEYRRQRDEGRKSFISHDPLDPFVAQVISGEISPGERDEEEKDQEPPS